MCGRFTRLYTWSELVALYRLTGTYFMSNLEPRYNVCPTTAIDVIARDELNERHFQQMRWGLVPRWWSKPLKEMRVATFNARAETIADKPMFRDAFRRRRCLIPVSGYYEWRDTPDGKQPYYFTRKDGTLITIAGVHDEWSDPETGTALRSCAMVITSPNAFVAHIHDRMPVILEPEDFERWEQGDSKNAAALMRPAGDVLQAWPVSSRVNSSRAADDDASLATPDPPDRLL
jgi:putative SOS response-associated peptidase YedK